MCIRCIRSIDPSLQATAAVGFSVGDLATGGNSFPTRYQLRG